jgi:hypothetical protein
MTTPLTPQVRPDKNGKLVTRHVKTDAVGGRSASSMPAPTLGTATVKKVNRKKMIEDLAQIICEPPASPNRFTNTPSLRSVTSSLEEFKDDAMIKAVSDAMNDPESSRYLKGLIVSGFYYGEDKLEGYLKVAISVDKMFATMEAYGGQLPSSLNSDVSNLFSEMGFKEREFKEEITDEHVGYFQATLIANKLGIRNSRSQINNVYYKQIESIRENMDRIVPALPVLVPVLSRDYYKETYKDIVDVLDTIDRSGHDPVDIGNVMIERGTQDFGLVEEILGNGVKSVSSGVL